MADVKSSVRSYYDTFAGVYDTKHGVTGAGQVYNFSKYYEPFLRRTIKPGSKVLELGCGTGVYTKWLVDHGCDVVAMDISGGMLKEARERCPEAVFVEGDCENPADALPQEMRSGAFDYVLGINTFSYYPNKREAMAAYHDLLRSGGRVVFIDMNGRCPLYRVMKWTGKNEMPQWYQHISESNAHVLKEVTREAGFDVRSLTHFTFVPNALGRSALQCMKPIDHVLSSLPLIRRFGMRIAMVAERT